MRRPVIAGLAIVLAAVALPLVVIAPRSDAAARAVLDRAIARTDGLRTVHFEIRGRVRADSPYPEQQPAGGILNQDLELWGEIVFPDQLRLSAMLGPSGEGPRQLVVVGERAWTEVAGSWRPTMARGPTTDPRWVLDLLKGPGRAQFAGYGVNGGRLTYHLRLDLDEAALAERQKRRGALTSSQFAGQGRFDVYVGVLDDRIYRQEVEILEQSGGELSPGSGLYRVRTSFGVDYADFDAPVVIKSPAEAY